MKLFLSPKFQIQEVVSESLVLDKPELVIQSETEAVEDKFENLVDQAEQKITEGKSIVFSSAVLCYTAACDPQIN